jgi:hypothetical protein
MMSYLIRESKRSEDRHSSTIDKTVAIAHSRCRLPKVHEISCFASLFWTCRAAVQLSNMRAGLELVLSGDNYLLFAAMPEFGDFR